MYNFKESIAHSAPAVKGQPFSFDTANRMWYSFLRTQNIHPA